jgi:hypothetical protein
MADEGHRMKILTKNETSNMEQVVSYWGNLVISSQI